MPICREVAMSEDYADFIINFAGPESEAVTMFGGVCYQQISGFYGTIYRPLDEIERLSLTNYEYNSIPALYGLSERDIRIRQRDMEAAIEQAGIFRLQNQPVLQLKGENCLVAFVDTGINIEDEAFRYSNGNTRILRLWDMTDNSGTPPLGIAYGSEYDREDINKLLKNAGNGEEPGGTYPAHDNDEHGNILARIAAGNDGAVPECNIIAVKLKPAKQYLREFHKVREGALAYQENDIMLAVNYIKAVALQLNMPVSLCLALGTNSRGHDGRSALSYILDNFGSVSAAVVSVAGGEEGNKQLHYRGTISPADDFVNVEFRVDERQQGLAINLWGINPQIYSVGLLSPTGEVVPRIPARIGMSDTYRLLFERTTVTVEYDLAERDSGDELIRISLDEPTAGIWTLQVYGDDGRFDVYLPLSQFIYENTYFLVSEPETTIVDPAYSRLAVTSVSYNPTTGALYIGEGRGFARNGYVKPDLASPVSVAILAGAVAQLLDWGIKSGNMAMVESADIKSYLIRGAIRDSSRVYPNREWGYGKLDVYNAFEVLRGN